MGKSVKVKGDSKIVSRLPACQLVLCRPASEGVTLGSLKYVHLTDDLGWAGLGWAGLTLKLHTDDDTRYNLVTQLFSVYHSALCCRSDQCRDMDNSYN